MKQSILTVLLLATGLSASAATLTLNPSSTNLYVGDSFTVQVLGSTASLESIVGFGFDYTLSTAAVAYQSYSIGPLFTDLALGTPAISGSANSITGESGTNVLLATFSLIASAEGTSVLHIVGNNGSDPAYGLFLLTGANQDFTFSNIDSQVSLDVQATPEPTSFLMFGLGGVMLAIRRRR